MLKIWIILFLIGVGVLLFPFESFSEENTSSSLEEIKSLLADKEDPAALQKAFYSLQDLIQKNTEDYDLRVQGADTVYYLSNLLPTKAEKKKFLNPGIEWSKQAIALAPHKPGGHFYYGMLTGLKAQLSDFMTALLSKDVIKNEMEKVVKIDPSFSDGDAYLALGEWYAAVPFFMGGSDDQAKQYFRKAIEISPGRAKPHLFLAEFYAKNLKYDLAKKEIDMVLATTLNAENSFETIRDQTAAKELLKKIVTKLSVPVRGYQKGSTPPTPSPVSAGNL